MTSLPQEDDWKRLAVALRGLHRALIQNARRDYERDHHQVLTSGRFLQLLMSDAFFAWLRPLSELMADVDHICDFDRVARDELSDAVRAAVELLIGGQRTTGPFEAFGRHYRTYLTDDPDVAMAHADVKRAVSSWPEPGGIDEASLLHERHRLAERAKHRRSK